MTALYVRIYLLSFNFAATMARISSATLLAYLACEVWQKQLWDRLYISRERNPLILTFRLFCFILFCLHGCLHRRESASVNQTSRKPLLALQVNHRHTYSPAYTNKGAQTEKFAICIEDREYVSTRVLKRGKDIFKGLIIRLIGWTFSRYSISCTEC